MVTVSICRNWNHSALILSTGFQRTVKTLHVTQTQLQTGNLHLSVSQTSESLVDACQMLTLQLPERRL